MLEDEPEIKYCKIFPPIGIARVGNSEEDYFIGPEVPGQLVQNAGQQFKDASGRVLRQAARFRVYGFDENDNPIKELTSDNAVITWMAQLANKKASWHRFEGAEKAKRVLMGEVAPPERRNKHIVGDERRQLEINAAKLTVSGRSQTSEAFSGRFLGVEDDIYLGELRTDEKGHLVVLGGKGRSGTAMPDNPLANYANNEAWFDDTSDGPVSAEVEINGQSLEVRGSNWVLVAPPHYSPYTQNFVSLYDTMLEAAIERKLNWPAEFGEQPQYEDPVSFQNDILPFLRRVSQMQWVSAKANRGHGQGSSGDFMTSEKLALLSDPDKARQAKSVHKRIFEQIRTPLHYPGMSPEAMEYRLDPESQDAKNQANLHHMPALSGDGGDAEHDKPTTWMTVTARQYQQLMCWQAGDFQNDWNRSADPTEGWHASFDSLGVAERPMALTRAALESCQGGGLYPGIEITSISRLAEFYNGEAFRVSDEYGPGDITKWMAGPWQADFHACESHWWPAIRPDEVISEETFEALVNEEGKVQEASQFKRVPWARGEDELTVVRPGFPSWKEGESLAEYHTRATEALEYQLSRFNRFRFYSWALRARELTPERTPGRYESATDYAKRVASSLQKGILKGVAGFKFPIVTPNETAPEYQERLQRMLTRYFITTILIPAPIGDEDKDAYLERVASTAANNVLYQNIVAQEWRTRYAHLRKNEFLKRWSILGFVTPRSVNDEETVMVETGRARYDGLSWRDYFYIVNNPAKFPGFFDSENSKAREIADSFFSQGRALYPSFEADPSQSQYRSFKYSRERLNARLDKLYEDNQERVRAFEAGAAPLFRDKESVRKRILELSPFNRLDGAWLQGIGRAGPSGEVESLLFQIWVDELGGGKPELNHSNVYEDLLHSAGYYLPPVNSREYADYPDIDPRSYSIGVYQLCIAQYSQEYFPELLGMTLYLEWDANALQAGVQLLEHYGYPPLFYSLHVAIDNAVEGHGAKAKEAVHLYLDNIYKKSGEKGVQEHWQRIWNGFVSFANVGGADLSYRNENPPTTLDKMVEMLDRKKQYAQANHGSRSLDANSINHWFDDPWGFLKVLSNSAWVVRGNPSKSPIFGLMSPYGRMLQVFTTDEQELWREWISSLTPDAHPETGRFRNRDHARPEDAMMSLMELLRAQSMGAGAHKGKQLTVTEGNPDDGKRLTQSLSYWFSTGNPKLVMLALRDPATAWVLPGDLENSQLTRVLLTNNRMSQVLSLELPQINNLTGKVIIANWIRAGAIVPDPQPSLPAVTARNPQGIVAALQPFAQPLAMEAMPAAEEEPQTKLPFDQMFLLAAVRSTTVSRQAAAEVRDVEASASLRPDEVKLKLGPGLGLPH